MHPGQVGWEADGWFSYRLDTRSRRKRWAIRQAGYPGGRDWDSWWGPRATQTCYFMGTRLSRSLEICVCG